MPKPVLVFSKLGGGRILCIAFSSDSCVLHQELVYQLQAVQLQVIALCFSSYWPQVYAHPDFYIQESIVLEGVVPKLLLGLV